MTHQGEDANRTKVKEQAKESLVAKDLVVHMEVMEAMEAFNLATKKLLTNANNLMFHIQLLTTSVKRLS